MTDSSERKIDGEIHDEQFEYTRRVSPDGKYIKGREISAVTRTGNTVAGKWAREQMDSTEDMSVGYKQYDGLSGVHDIALPRESILRHTVISGATGYGKSTVLLNLMRQFAQNGDGFIHIDSSGSGVKGVLTSLPDKRMSDVSLVGEHDGKHWGINIFDTVYTPDDGEIFVGEVQSIVDTVTQAIHRDSYWSEQMDVIVETFINGIVRLNANGYEYTIEDFYKIVSDEDYREEFATQIEDELSEEDVLSRVEQLTDTIDTESFELLQRRLEPMVSEYALNIIGDPSGEPLSSVLSNNSIVLATMSQDRESISTLLFSRVWAHRQTQKWTNQVDDSTAQRDTFGVFVDDVDTLVTKGWALPSALSKGRSLQTPIFMSVQQPSNIPDEQRQSILGNCGSFVLLNPGAMDEANVFTRFINGLGSKELVSLSRFEATIQTLIDSEPELIKEVGLYPDSPPVRTYVEAVNQL